MFAKRFLVLTVATASFGSAAVVQAGSLGPAREAAAVTHLVKAANQHSLNSTMNLFDSSPTLRVGKRTLKGRSAIQSWWRTEFSHHLKAALQTKLQVQANQTRAVISRTTQGGDCAKKCVEAAQWQFVRGKVSTMTLTGLKKPAIKVPKRPTSVPTPPKGTPLPNVTPTVPS